MQAIGPLEYEFIFIDFEFRPIDGREGNPLEVICMVAFNTRTGVYTRLWADELYQLNEHPLGSNPNAVLVAYYASAELASFISLGWNWSGGVLDLYLEFKNYTNGRNIPTGDSLLGAMKFFNLDAIETEHKESMRSLALRGGPFSETEKISLIEYCQSDVDALARLFEPMSKFIDLPRALLRGEYMVAIAQMETHGIPIDHSLFEDLGKNWEPIKTKLITRIDQHYGVYERGSFREIRFEEYLAKHQIPWDRHPSGRLKMDSDTFKQMANIYPLLLPLKDLRDSLSKMRLNKLQVGTDGWYRCLLSPFKSLTGRNQPSNSKFIFGQAKWARGLIQPKPGRAIAYIDWSQQEFGVAASMSGDQKMMEAYQSGDPYLAFAKQAGAVPSDATKSTHPHERDLYKQCVLATQYGMGPHLLALIIKQPKLRAQQLLKAHRNVYQKFWSWSDDGYNKTVNANVTHTRFGWVYNLKSDENPRRLRNFPMQANSAEMLRIACILIRKAGVTLCAPLHDAILIESSNELIEEHTKIAQRCMVEASKILLDGFALSSDAEIIHHPNRFLDKSTQPFWDQVMEILSEVKADAHSESELTC